MSKSICTPQPLTAKNAAKMQASDWLQLSFTIAGKNNPTPSNDFWR
jgi:hypothetical protein